jgi:hypothetical protein
MINPLKWIIHKYDAWHKKYYSVDATCRRQGYVDWSEYECLLEEKNLRDKE